MFLLLLVLLSLEVSTQILPASTARSLYLYHTVEQLLRLRKPPQCSIPSPRLFRLTRIDPKKVGHKEWIKLVDGKKHKRQTRARNPPIFEIPKFLTPKECSYLVKMSAHQLSLSRMSGDGKLDIKGDLKKIHRVSNSTFIALQGDDPVLKNITERVIKLTQLPRDIVEETEPVQIVHYRAGGHYHAHLDSSDVEGTSQAQCEHHCHGPPEYVNSQCESCRYITVLLYLNDVEEGGETAFPIADRPNWREKGFNVNLSYNCEDSSVIVQPRKGTAVMWYNNLMDPETGLLSKADEYSFHGGCDVVKGEKWVANYWIDASTAKRGYKPTKHITKWT